MDAKDKSKRVKTNDDVAAPKSEEAGASAAASSQPASSSTAAGRSDSNNAAAIDQNMEYLAEVKTNLQQVLGSLQAFEEVILPGGVSDCLRDENIFAICGTVFQRMTADFRNNIEGLAMELEAAESTHREQQVKQFVEMMNSFYNNRNNGSTNNANNANPDQQ